jgi:hypothetical protein
MYLVIVLSGGRQVDALLLSATTDSLRVVIPGRGDAAEFRLVEGRWISESGGRVELGAILNESSTDVQRVLGNARPRARSAS